MQNAFVIRYHTTFSVMQGTQTSLLIIKFIIRMSKTYSDQMDKAKVLVAGLRKNYEQIKEHGISLDELSMLERAIGEGENLNKEVERLRSETSEMSAQANRKLITVKDKSLELKRIVKRHIDIDHWKDFGVMDKR